MPSHIRRENKECAGTFGLKAEVCSALINKSLHEKTRRFPTSPEDFWFGWRFAQKIKEFLAHEKSLIFCCFQI